MKVLLINPPWEGYISRKGKIYNRKWPPLSLLNCASLLEKKSVKVELLDLNTAPMEPEEIRNICHNYDKIFVTSSPLHRWQCPNLDIEAFLKFMKEIEAHDLFIMGAHATIDPKGMLELTQAKAIIRQEPEFTVLDICEKSSLDQIQGIAFKRNDMIISTGNRNPVDLETLPIPAYHLVDIKKYHYELLGNKVVLLETSRGCPFNCEFCLKVMYGEGIRKKTVNQVIKEIEYAIKLGAKNIYFIDLEFIIDKNFVSDLCEEITKRQFKINWCCQTRPDSVDNVILKKMKEAGCKLIHYGIESGSDRILEQINKKIELDQIIEGIRLTKEVGIEIACFFMLGFPDENKEEMMKTIGFAKKLNPTYASFHIVIPYSSTKLSEQCGSKGPFPEVCSKIYSLQELNKITREAFIKFYLKPRYIFSNAFRFNLKSIFRKAILFKKFVG